MSARACPSIGALLTVLTPEADGALVTHVEDCLACQGVLALHGNRDRVADDVVCAHAELWLAERDLGQLGAADAATLSEHLADCAGCRAIASDPATDG